MRIAGLDEAGRGSLFGPVVAAAVILNPRRRIVGLDDSKKLNAERRNDSLLASVTTLSPGPSQKLTPPASTHGTSIRPAARP